MSLAERYKAGESDDRIRYRTLEQAAIAQADVEFVLLSNNLSGAAMEEAFVKALSE